MPITYQAIRKWPYHGPLMPVLNIFYWRDFSHACDVKCINMVSHRNSRMSYPAAILSFGNPCSNLNLCHRLWTEL